MIGEINLNVNNSMIGGAKRKSNIELYRIITMLLIVATHYVNNSGLMEVDGPIYGDILSWRSLFLLVIGAWGKVGINCFVIITGYFMCKSHITLKKFLKLICEVMFYRIVVNSIFWISGYADFSAIGLIETLIPIRIIGNNFESCFVVFYLFIPFLNVLVDRLGERQHVLLLALVGFTYVFLGTVPFFSITTNYVSWFIVLFLIASYIRLYPKTIFDNRRLWGLLSLAFVGLAILSIVCLALLFAKCGKGVPYSFVTDSNTFLAVAISICSFLYFKNLRIGFSKVINAIASTTFGVFLIQRSSDTMRQWLRKDLVDCVGNYNADFLPFYAIGCIMAVFAICSCIDLLRIKIIETPCLRLYDYHEKTIEWRCKCILDKLFKRMGIED